MSRETTPNDNPLEGDEAFVCQPCDSNQSQSMVGNTNSTESPIDILYEEEVDDPKELQVGDHVYQWRSYAGVPRIFQHHGIIMDIIQDDETGQIKLTIADFSNVEPTKRKKQEAKKSKEKRRSGLFQEGIVRTYTDLDQWHKVQYESSWWKRQVFRAGTITGAKSDAIGLVLARVNFIIQYPEVLPDYHVIYSNCECVAFWCKTGHWCTLQASSFLELTAAGQVKQSATIATAAASTQVTVPAAGVWGWLGFTTHVSYISLHPMVMPALAGYAGTFTLSIMEIFSICIFSCSH